MSAPQLTIGELFGNPDLHLHAFEAERAAFVRMDRAAYARSIFLDARISTAAPDAFGVPLAPLVETSAKHGAAAPGWIFHVAQCGSTLLARALDDAARSLVLREPMALRQLGAARAQSWGQPLPPGLARLIGLESRMLARRYDASAPVVAKTNVPVNLIAADLLAAAQRPAIFLYFPLEPYLAAILRTPNHRRWMHGVITELRAPIAALAGDPAALPDGPRAAALWLAQMRLYADALGRFESARSLDAAQLFDDPATTVLAAARHFGIDLDAAAVAGIVEGPLFSSYSKNPTVAFDRAQRRAREQATLAEVADDIAAARRWLEGREVPAALGRPLLGDAPSLL